MSKAITIVTGNLGKDPELKYTSESKPFTRISVASKNRKKTIWFNVTVWGKTAEAVAQYCKKGSLVEVVGTLDPDDEGNPRTWQNNSGVTKASYDMTADSVDFLDRKSSNGAEGDDESEIPF